jgi:hypothetical protein
MIAQLQTSFGRQIHILGLPRIFADLIVKAVFWGWSPNWCLRRILPMPIPLPAGVTATGCRLPYMLSHSDPEFFFSFSAPATSVPLIFVPYLLVNLT